jgi:uncharacterized protein (DUF2267 family)
MTAKRLIAAYLFAVVAGFLVGGVWVAALSHPTDPYRAIRRNEQQIRLQEAAYRHNQAVLTILNDELQQQLTTALKQRLECGR